MPKRIIYIWFKIIMGMPKNNWYAQDANGMSYI